MVFSDDLIGYPDDSLYLDPGRIRRLRRRISLQKENWLYYVGDTFRFWTGPAPEAGDPQANKVIQQIENAYISNNLIKECIDRNVAGMVGLMPQWYLRIGEEESPIDVPVEPTSRDPLATTGEGILQTWLDQMLRHVALQDSDTDSNPLTQAVTQMNVTGRGYLRLYQPKRFKDSSNADAKLYNRIRLHCPPPGSVSIDRDDDGEIEQITYTYDGGTETQQLNPDTGVVKFTIAGKSVEAEDWTSDFGGHWTIYELRSPALINEDIKRLQNAINKTLTMLGRNLDQAGFLERIITNAQMPGQWIDDPARPGKQKFIPDERGLQVGAGKTTFLSGIKTPEGSYLSPGITYRDPVNIATFDQSINLFAKQMYLAFNQGHILASGDGNMSGVSREQLRQDANLPIDRRALVIENAFANILEVVLRFVDPLKFANVYATVKLRKSLNLLTPDASAEIRNNYQAKLMSRATAMSKLGIENPDAEAALIDEELHSDMMKAVAAAGATHSTMEEGKGKKEKG